MVLRTLLSVKLDWNICWFAVPIIYNGKFNSILAVLNGVTRWQHWFGKHFCPAHDILGSVYYNVQSESGAPAQIGHLVLKCFTEPVIECNYTEACDISNHRQNRIRFPDEDHNWDNFTFVNHVRHSCTPADIFTVSNSRSQYNYSIYTHSQSSQLRMWVVFSLKEADKVHKHVYGHAL